MQVSSSAHTAMSRAEAAEMADSASLRSVLFIGAFVSRSQGSRGISEDLAAQLAERGWTVQTTSSARSRWGRLLDILHTCWRDRGRYQVAVVDLYSGAAFLWAQAACWMLRRLHRPYLLILHGGNLPRFAARWPHAVGRLLRSAAVVATPSRYLLEQMQQSRNDLRLLPNGLEISAYHYRPRSSACPRLVWLRAFHSVYNPEIVPEVVSRLVKEFPQVQVTMIGADKGDGSLQRTRRAASRLEVDGHIHLVGSVPKRDVPAQLADADIFLNTARVDNTPVSVLEAMATGLGVISTDVGGIPYLLDSEHDALLVPPDDADAMAAAIRRMLTDPGLIHRLSTQARRKVEQFDWSVLLPRWEELLISVVCNRQGTQAASVNAIAAKKHKRGTHS